MFLEEYDKVVSSAYMAMYPFISSFTTKNSAMLKSLLKKASMIINFRICKVSLIIKFI